MKRKKRQHRTAGTSKAALRSNADRLQHQERLVLQTIRALGRTTRQQVAAVAHIEIGSACGRINRLMKKRLVRNVLVKGRKLVQDGRHVVEARAA